MEGVFDVYGDFLTYEGGVYYNVTGKYIGVHTVEIFGWGKGANNTDYWLCKNSWGESWGLDGYFMIKMGNCGINEFLSACEPLVPGST